MFYATKLGERASEGTAGLSSVFTRNLLKFLPDPNLLLSDVIVKVIEAVQRETGTGQNPVRDRDDCYRWYLFNTEKFLSRALNIHTLTQHIETLETGLNRHIDAARTALVDESGLPEVFVDNMIE